MNLAKADLRAKAVLAVGLLLAALAADAVGLALLLVAAEGLLLASGLARRQRVLLAAALLGLPFALLNAALVPGDAVASVAGVAFSRPGLDAGLRVAARGVLAVAVGLWLAATPPRAVVGALRRAPRLAVALAGAARFAPAAAEDWARIGEAQALRGRRADAREIAPRLVPLMVATVRRGRLLQEALEASAFGSGPRTTRPSPPWRALDAAVALAGLAFLAVALRAGGLA